MKKILIIVLLCIVTFVTAQENDKPNFGLLIDWSNALNGSKVNKPALNYKLTFSDHYNGSKHIRLGFFFEQFKEINYLQFGTSIDYILTPKQFNLNNVSILKNFNLIIGAEVGVVYRNTSYANNAINPGINLELLISLKDIIDKPSFLDNLSICIQLNREQANDVSQQYRNSTYSGLKLSW